MAAPPAGVIGTLNYDLTLFVDRIPQPGGEARVLRIERRLGGKGGNTVTALAKILGGARFFGALGRDEAMQAHAEFFKAINVDFSWVMISNDVGSGVSFVMVDPEGQNTVSSYPGANALVNEEYVRSVLGQLTGLKLLIATNLSPRAASLALEAVNGVKIYVPAVHSRLDPEGVRRAPADYLVVNEEEQRWIEGFRGKVIRTMGSKGSELVVDGDVRASSPAVDLRALGLSVKSTVGAGDAFTGALGAFLYLGLSDEESMALANVAAAIKVTRDDPRGSPTLKEVLELAERLSSDPRWGILKSPVAKLRRVAEEALSNGGV